MKESGKYRAGFIDLSLHTSHITAGSISRSPILNYTIVPIEKQDSKDRCIRSHIAAENAMKSMFNKYLYRTHYSIIPKSEAHDRFNYGFAIGLMEPDITLFS